MKWLRTIVVFDKGSIVSSQDWKLIHDSYVKAIQSIDHPEGTGSFTIRKKVKLNKKGKTQQWARNGVSFVRKRFLDYLVGKEHWEKEQELDFGKKKAALTVPLTLYPSGENYTEPVTTGFGEFDFVTKGKNGLRVALEWETGNISSSHRSVNKLCVCLNAGVIDAGVVIVPSRELYTHITDRIGNINELSGYLSLWEASKVRVKRGVLAITVVSHDELTEDVDFPFLPVGNDGRSAAAKIKSKKRPIPKRK